MKKCSAKAFSMCPDRAVCGSLNEAVYMEGSDCEKFNEAADKQPLDDKEAQHRGKLLELLNEAGEWADYKCDKFGCEICPANKMKGNCAHQIIVDRLIAHGVTVQECAYWQYIEEDVDEDNNIQAYCSFCGAGDKHATNMIGKVPYCWKCGRKMIPQPPKGE